MLCGTLCSTLKAPTASSIKLKFLSFFSLTRVFYACGTCVLHLNRHISIGHISIRRISIGLSPLGATSLIVLPGALIAPLLETLFVVIVSRDLQQSMAAMMETAIFTRGDLGAACSLIFLAHIT
jgi:hypothetical protein